LSFLGSKHKNYYYLHIYGTLLNLTGSYFLNMKWKNRTLSVVILLVLLAGTVGCPMMMGPPGGMVRDIPMKNFTKPFSVVYQIDYDEESFPYITIYYNVPYSGITFLKGGSLYYASFSLNVNIKHEGETIVNKSITEVFQTNDYSKTVSGEKSFFGTFKENISTGKNEILLMLMDKNSDRRYVWKREVLASGASDTLRQD